MTYNKKQMQPLIDKYGINPETNKLFINVCEMFDGQTNYQIWAVKMIFSQILSYDNLTRIHDWIQTNSSSINKLAKQNIVSYSNKSGISQLLKEIEGIERMTLIKNIISHFNTAQRKMLTDSILGGDITPLMAYESETIKKWYDIFNAFNKKPMSIKNKFYSTCSAFTSAIALQKAISDCLSESYDWKAGKEDLLAYIEHNTKDCEVVFNEGNCIIVRVPSFDSSHKLCGSGRTGWCISREESYFKSYVTSNSKRSQYFLFDFNRKETDAFAHIGFTVEGGNGIVEAQTSHNYSMMTPFEQGDEKLSIHDVLKNFGVNKKVYMRLPSNIGFKWDILSVLDMVEKSPESFAVAYEGNGRLVINVLTIKALHSIIGETFIKTSCFDRIDKTHKSYLFMDFNLPFDDDRSLVAMQYLKDDYGTYTLCNMEGLFGDDFLNEDFFGKIGMSTNSFLNQEAIAPSILLHKYIDENDELAAIKLIEKERDNIDINYEFRQNVPVFSAINHKMYKLFDVLVNSEGFDSKVEDGFGETLLESLLYLQGCEEIHTSEEDTKLLTSMIKSILRSKNFDFNATDLNNDTAINLACEYESDLWVVEALVSKKDVNINVVNDYDCSAITNCIRNKNLGALKLIGQRPDLILRKVDTKLAKECGINLKEYIKPTESIFGKNVLELCDSQNISSNFEESLVVEFEKA